MNKAEQARCRRLVAYGCVACRINGWYSAPDMHHVLTGGRRTGHMDTLPLCPWHHRGVRFEVFSDEQMAARFGESLARSKRKFVDAFGTERELLAMVNEEIAGVHAALS